MATLNVNPRAIPTLPDVTILPDFYQALLSHGYSTDDAALIMGGNPLRFLAEALPD
ncbi:MAG: hypothetical protein HYR94_20095 [Chloroflexi bacterium]|nr:hypothetical protein [Chloroflexota bacterium]